MAAKNRTAPLHSVESVPSELRGRFAITDVAPTVLSGRRPAAAVESECVPIFATCFREGHDELGVEVRLVDPAGNTASLTRMRSTAGSSSWVGEVRPTSIGSWSFFVEAWSDPWESWLHRAVVKVPAGIDVDLELEEGALLLDAALADIQDIKILQYRSYQPISTHRHANNAKAAKSDHYVQHQYLPNRCVKQAPF